MMKESCKTMKVIGLTGPTGAGKTVVAELMELPVVNADNVARQVHKNPAVLKQLCNQFGQDIASRGVLNRAVLATRAFSSKENTLALNAIMHPAITLEIERQLQELEQAGHTHCLLDAPLLFEADCAHLCHTTVGVLAPISVRKNRIIGRDSIPEEMALQRMNAQPDDQYYKDRCDYILLNNGDICELQEDVQVLREELMK